MLQRGKKVRAASAPKGRPAPWVRTRWTSQEIWLRRDFEISADALALEQLAKLHLWIHHDDACEIYINGTLAAKRTGFTIDYEMVALTSAGLAALRPGRNVLAVHCAQTTGGQYIDVGIAVVEPTVVAGGGDAEGMMLPPEAVDALLAAPNHARPSRTSWRKSIARA